MDLSSWKGKSAGRSYHLHTLYHRPGSSPQVAMLLPGEAMRRHCQDLISMGAETNKNADKLRNLENTEEKQKAYENV